MLDTNQLNEYIKNLGNLTSKPDTLYLKEIISQYPFFNSAHLLYFLAQNQKEGIFTGASLSRTAIYSGNRSRLYQYLYKPDSTKSDELAFEYPAEAPVFETNGQKSEPKEPESPEVKKQDPKTAAVIDQFIQTKPSIRKPKAEFFSPVDAASKSIEDHEDFATETLANIFVRQENYQKAIAIYERLSLLNPEKSDYFADLINTLKEKINE